MILKIAHRQYQNHNGGQLAFGPDGYLYIGTGDGGGGGDPLGNGQNTNALLARFCASMSRAAQRRTPFPPTIPFVESVTAARPEIWAYGLRNPWRFSFDRTTGDLVYR